MFGCAGADCRVILAGARQECPVADFTANFLFGSSVCGFVEVLFWL